MLFVAFCERKSHYHFFSRFSRAVADHEGRLIILSNRLSIVLTARRNGFRSELVSGASGRSDGRRPELDAYEIKAGLMTHEEFDEGLGRIENFIERFLKETPVDIFFFWNGSSFVARAMGAFVKQHGIKTLYFEIANFPGKLFVDSEGVNIRSRFAACYREMDKSSVNMSCFEDWAKNFLEGKLRSHLVPQARVSTEFNWCYPIDMAGFYFGSAPWSEQPRVFTRTFSYLFSRLTRYVFDEFDPEKTRFFFFPLQVRTDSQILWNSPISIPDALRMAATLAAEAGAQLVVKPHPAEIDRLFVKRLSRLREELKFIFVNNNTFDLILNSEKVIIINSTVGLETMVCKRPLVCLGNPMYENFSRKDLAFYIQSYLLEVDFFDDQQLTDKQFEAILSRMDS